MKKKWAYNVARLILKKLDSGEQKKLEQCLLRTLSPNECIYVSEDTMPRSCIYGRDTNPIRLDVLVASIMVNYYNKHNVLERRSV